MHDRSAFTILVEAPDSGQRLDVLVSSLIPDCSRSTAANLIRAGTIQVQGIAQKPSYRVRPGDEIRGYFLPPEPITFKPEPIEIDILLEDTDIIVVNKPSGMVVHPAPGHNTGTLVNGLLYLCPDLAGIGGKLRPGIVHRLDKETSGLLVVAKNARAHHHLSLQFKSRQITKAYIALVYGKIALDAGTITLPIGRHPVDRKKMSTHSRKSRTAETLWRVRERFKRTTLLEINLKTGRTHQIRVHCAAINHPVVGDAVYGGQKAWKRAGSEKNLLSSVSRHMLHAWRLGFVHPATGSTVSIEAPIAQDFEQLLEALRQE
ncbi:MAG: RluA family pseudouridine synthase [Desulfobacterales bacterium]|nr:MAG: RluA family pseudouridine synthase [Desulfobacterales bacterium]UCD89297.1 MAG: RluA family pseudouridine synthase [Desulfobacterales bacterium]